MSVGFVADMMLGKLARWLRILGQDTIYPDFTDDGRILEFAKQEKRTLLTQDVELAMRAKKKGVGALLVPRDVEVEAQVEFVFRACSLRINFPEGTLCPQCNGKLEVAGREKVEGNENVPNGALERNFSFWLCESCKKVYWQGSHWKRIKKSVERIELELKRMS
jgi:uncharacterized protein